MTVTLTVPRELVVRARARAKTTGVLLHDVLVQLLEAYAGGRTHSLTRDVAAQMGKVGGAARARALSPARRTQIARRAARARWEKDWRTTE